MFAGWNYAGWNDLLSGRAFVATRSNQNLSRFRLGEYINFFVSSFLEERQIREIEKLETQDRSNSCEFRDSQKCPLNSR